MGNSPTPDLRHESHTRAEVYLPSSLNRAPEREREDPLHGRAHLDGVINYITGCILIGREGGGGGSSPTASSDERAGERSRKSNKLLLMQKGLRKIR